MFQPIVVNPYGVICLGALEEYCFRHPEDECARTLTLAISLTSNTIIIDEEGIALLAKMLNDNEPSGMTASELGRQAI